MVTLTALVALLVCLIPTTIGGLLSAVGVAGMSRMMQANVIATSGRAVEAAGDVDVLLLDKTGTITHGNRQARAFLPAPGVSRGPAGARRAAGVAGRRNARRPQHRRAGPPRRRRRPGRRRRALRALHRPDPHERRRPAAARQPGRRSSRHAQGRGGRGAQARASASAAPCRPKCCAPPTRSRAAAARRWRSAEGSTRAGHRRTQGHRQDRHQGALRRAAPHGHQDRDDHRRQQAHGRGHRGRGRRRRLPGRSHARGQARS